MPMMLFGTEASKRVGLFMSEVERLKAEIKAMKHDHTIIIEHAMDMNKTIKFLKKEILADKEGDYDLIMFIIKNHIASYNKGDL